MRIAILDLGTNTFNIFIAELLAARPSSLERQEWTGFTKIYKSKIAVKLGEGGINKNFIEEMPFQRGINALTQHRKTIEEFGAKKIVAFATSAIRSASNGKKFVEAAKEKAGIDVQVISGEREAELIYYGVRSAVEMHDTPSLIIDIGGGSTEFIIATKNEILWKHSFLLGAARLLDRFKPSDPITDIEVKQIENHFEQNLQPLLTSFNSPAVLAAGGCAELIGSSGSFDSLAEMIGYRFYNKEILKGKTEYSFNLVDFAKLYQVILKSTTQERLHMKGLTKMRVDMIVVSAIFVNFILNHLYIKKMRGSRYSLKEGVLWELIHS